MLVKRRGVSEIISTIIIILIVSIAGSLLFAYSAETFQRQQNTFLADNERTITLAEEKFRVSAVYWSGAGDVLDVAVYNYGLDDMDVTDIYIDGVRVETYTSGRNEVILTEKIKRVVFTSPVTVSLGETYTITVVSSNGVTRTDNWEAE